MELTKTLPSPDHATAEAEGESLHRRRHPTRWITALLAIAGLAFVVVSFARAQIDWGEAGSYLFDQRILSGVWRTALLTVVTFLIGLALGVGFGLMRLSSNYVVSSISWLYVWVFRGTPLLVQLLVWFNLALIFPTLQLPWTGGIATVEVMTPMVAAIVGLSINEGAYLAEVIRGGILSVDHGQSEAGMALGMSKRRTMWKVVLPQAMPAILPVLGNSAIGLLKTSSLATLVSYPELVNAAQSIYYVNGRVMELLMVAAFWYLIATSVMSVGQFYLERHFGRSHFARRATMVELLLGSAWRRAAKNKSQGASR